VPGADTDERIKKLREHLPREKLLSDYVLLVPKSKLEDTLGFAPSCSRKCPPVRLGSEPEVRLFLVLGSDPEFLVAPHSSDSLTGPQPRGSRR
jgi:hypothetical protein